VQGSRQLVTVQHSKVGEPQWQFSMAAGAMIEHQKMARAVHGLESKLALNELACMLAVFMLLTFEFEHVFLIVGQVP